MCTTRYWKRLDATNNSLLVTATRSDDVMFMFFETEFNSLKDFVSKLEEFRNCGCSQEVPCTKHAEERERIN